MLPISTAYLGGLKRDVSRIAHYLPQWDMLEPIGFRTYLEAAAIFRSARAKGVAVTTLDALRGERHGAWRHTVYPRQGLCKDRRHRASAALCFLNAPHSYRGQLATTLPPATNPGYPG